MYNVLACTGVNPRTAAWTGARSSACDGRSKRNAQKRCVSPLTELNKKEEDLLSRVEFLCATETLNCFWGEIKFGLLEGNSSYVRMEDLLNLGLSLP